MYVPAAELCSARTSVAPTVFSKSLREYNKNSRPHSIFESYILVSEAIKASNSTPLWKNFLSGNLE